MPVRTRLERFRSQAESLVTEVVPGVVREVSRQISQNIGQNIGQKVGQKVGGAIETTLERTLGGELSEKLRRATPSLDEAKLLLKNPRAFGAWIEEKSPWLNRRFLGAASMVTEPFLAGRGFRVERVDEELAEATLAGDWRNQGEGGTIHTGALVALGEFVSRLFWEFHLDLRQDELRACRVQIQVLKRPIGEMKAIFRWSVAERESVLHKLRASGMARVETVTYVYDLSGRLVAEVETDWEMQRKIALPAGSGKASEDQDGSVEN